MAPAALSPDTAKSSPPTSQSTTVTTPEQSPGVDDDIWASDDEHGRADPHPEGSSEATVAGPGRHEMLSDLPTIRRQHMTDGYREGLSIGKAKVMQQGFDEGYPIGLEISLRAGRVLGVLEGYLADRALDGRLKSEVEKTLVKAKSELSIMELLKTVDDEVIAAAKEVPDSIEKTLARWEEKVIASESIHEETSGQTYEAAAVG